MPLRDPIAAYNAANNIEAHLVCSQLTAAGIEAMVIEDVSVVGLWTFGILPEIHKPQVWIERADQDRARPVLNEHERRNAELQDPPASTGASIEVVCEDCGARSLFSAAQKGSVQTCPHCGSFVDVGEEEDDGVWAQTEEEASETAKEEAEEE